MKTKHKLKLLSLLPKGLKQYESLKEQLYLEAIGNAILKAEPIQEIKDFGPERFEPGEIVEIINNTSCHDFKIGEKVSVIAWARDHDNPEVSYYTCFSRNNKNGINGVLPKDIKKLPKQEQTSKEFKAWDKVRIKSITAFEGKAIHDFNINDKGYIKDFTDNEVHGVLARLLEVKSEKAQWVPIKDLEHI